MQPRRRARGGRQGAYPTSYHEEIEGSKVDHFVLDEAEEKFFPSFCNRAGVPVVAGGAYPTTWKAEDGTAKAIYRQPRRPDVTRTPLPRFDLISMKDYHMMCVQFSRGCPFDCEFCDITKLYGRVPRTKSPEQMVNEFESLYRLGWRGQVLLVDDNFIGNKRDAMKLLPVLAEWQKARGYPFTLFTEATVNLARMEGLMDVMIEAGFNSVFVGIETPTPKALIKMKKPQNVSKLDENYLFNAVRKIQRKGMQVSGGFILGLDEDDEGVFDAQIELIREVGIPMALLNLLSALKNTNLYNRLKTENRLLEKPGRTSYEFFLNFRTEMDRKTLVQGFQRVVTTIYDPTLENYFTCCQTLFEHLKPVPHLYKPVSKNMLAAMISLLARKLSPKQVPAYRKFIAKIFKDHPRMLPAALNLAAMGYHFEKVYSHYVAVLDFKEFLLTEFETFKEAGSQPVQEAEAIGDRKQQLFARVRARYESIPGDLRHDSDEIEQALAFFQSVINARAEARGAYPLGGGIKPRSEFRLGRERKHRNNCPRGSRAARGKF